MRQHKMYRDNIASSSYDNRMSSGRNVGRITYGNMYGMDGNRNNVLDTARDWSRNIGQVVRQGRQKTVQLLPDIQDYSTIPNRNVGRMRDDDGNRNVVLDTARELDRKIGQIARQGRQKVIQSFPRPKDKWTAPEKRPKPPPPPQPPRKAEGKRSLKFWKRRPVDKPVVENKSNDTQYGQKTRQSPTPSLKSQQYPPQPSPQNTEPLSPQSKPSSSPQNTAPLSPQSTPSSSPQNTLSLSSQSTPPQSPQHPSQILYYEDVIQRPSPSLPPPSPPPPPPPGPHKLRPMPEQSPINPLQPHEYPSPPLSHPSPPPSQQPLQPQPAPPPQIIFIQSPNPCQYCDYVTHPSTDVAAPTKHPLKHQTQHGGDDDKTKTWTAQDRICRTQSNDGFQYADYPYRHCSLPCYPCHCCLLTHNGGIKGRQTTQPSADEHEQDKRSKTRRTNSKPSPKSSNKSRQSSRCRLEKSLYIKLLQMLLHPNAGSRATQNNQRCCQCHQINRLPPIVSCHSEKQNGPWSQGHSYKKCQTHPQDNCKNQHTGKMPRYMICKQCRSTPCRKSRRIMHCIPLGNVCQSTRSVKISPDVQQCQRSPVVCGIKGQSTNSCMCCKRPFECMQRDDGEAKTIQGNACKYKTIQFSISDKRKKCKRKPIHLNLDISQLHQFIDYQASQDKRCSNPEGCSNANDRTIRNQADVSTQVTHLEEKSQNTPKRQCSCENQMRGGGKNVTNCCAHTELMKRCVDSQTISSKCRSRSHGDDNVPCNKQINLQMKHCTNAHIFPDQPCKDVIANALTRIRMVNGQLESTAVNMKDELGLTCDAKKLRWEDGIQRLPRLMGSRMTQTNSVVETVQNCNECLRYYPNKWNGSDSGYDLPGNDAKLKLINLRTDSFKHDCNYVPNCHQQMTSQLIHNTNDDIFNDISMTPKQNVTPSLDILMRVLNLESNNHIEPSDEREARNSKQCSKLGMEKTQSYGLRKLGKLHRNTVDAEGRKFNRPDYNSSLTKSRRIMDVNQSRLKSSRSGQVNQDNTDSENETSKSSRHLHSSSTERHFSKPETCQEANEIEHNSLSKQGDDFNISDYTIPLSENYLDHVLNDEDKSDADSPLPLETYIDKDNKSVTNECKTSATTGTRRMSCHDQQQCVLVEMGGTVPQLTDIGATSSDDMLKCATLCDTTLSSTSDSGKMNRTERSVPSFNVNGQYLDHSTSLQNVEDNSPTSPNRINVDSRENSGDNSLKLQIRMDRYKEHSKTRNHNIYDNSHLSGNSDSEIRGDSSYDKAMIDSIHEASRNDFHNADGSPFGENHSDEDFSMNDHGEASAGIAKSFYNYHLLGRPKNNVEFDDTLFEKKWGNLTFSLEQNYGISFGLSTVSQTRRVEISRQNIINSDDKGAFDGEGYILEDYERQSEMSVIDSSSYVSTPYSNTHQYNTSDSQNSAHHTIHSDQYYVNNYCDDGSENRYDFPTSMNTKIPKENVGNPVLSTSYKVKSKSNYMGNTKKSCVSDFKGGHPNKNRACFPTKVPCSQKNKASVDKKQAWSKKYKTHSNQFSNKDSYIQENVKSDRSCEEERRSTENRPCSSYKVNYSEKYGNPVYDKQTCPKRTECSKQDPNTGPCFQHHVKSDESLVDSGDVKCQNKEFGFQDKQKYQSYKETCKKKGKDSIRSGDNYTGDNRQSSGTSLYEQQSSCSCQVTKQSSSKSSPTSPDSSQHHNNDPDHCIQSNSNKEHDSDLSFEGLLSSKKTSSNQEIPCNKQKSNGCQSKKKTDNDTTPRKPCEEMRIPQISKKENENKNSGGVQEEMCKEKEPIVIKKNISCHNASDHENETVSMGKFESDIILSSTSPPDLSLDTSVSEKKRQSNACAESSTSSSNTVKETFVPCHSAEPILRFSNKNRPVASRLKIRRDRKSPCSKCKSRHSPSRRRKCRMVLPKANSKRTGVSECACSVCDRYCCCCPGIVEQCHRMHSNCSCVYCEVPCEHKSPCRLYPACELQRMFVKKPKCECPFNEKLFCCDGDMRNFMEARKVKPCESCCRCTQLPRKHKIPYTLGVRRDCNKIRCVTQKDLFLHPQKVASKSSYLPSCHCSSSEVVEDNSLYMDIVSDLYNTPVKRLCPKTRNSSVSEFFKSIQQRCSLLRNILSSTVTEYRSKIARKKSTRLLNLKHSKKSCKIYPASI